MDTFLEKLKKAKDATRFEADRKASGRLILSEYMEARERAARSGKRRIVRGLFVSFANALSNPLPALAAVAIVALLLAGGGTALAAQRALPGDFLYPLKVGVNERIVGALQFSPAMKAQYHAALAARRLEEASRLAMREETAGSEKFRAELAERFDAHAKDAEQEIAKVSAEGNTRVAADIASRFETDLRVNEKISASARGQANTGFGEKKKNAESFLRARVHGVLGNVAALRMKIERKVTAQAAQPDGDAARKTDEALVAAEGKVNAAANAIAETRAYLNLKRALLGAQAAADAEECLASADKFAARARVSIEAGSYGEAFNFGNEAIRTAQETKSLMHAKTDLHFDVDLRDDMSEDAPEMQSNGGNGAPGMKIGL